MTRPYRILITGSANWRKPRLLLAALRSAVKGAGDRPVVIVHGQCPAGADYLAESFATANGWKTEPTPADWDHCGPKCPADHRRMKWAKDRLHPGNLPDYCPAAGPRRNHAMVSKGAEVCLAFVRDHSPGTTGCGRLAERRGIDTQWFFDCKCHHAWEDPA